MSTKIFTLEAIAAKHGDCLLLHWGSKNDPRLILIDGGPNGVYTSFLKKRLEVLRQSRGTPLPLDLVMVSHIDQDHIKGILDLTGQLEDLDDQGRALPYEIDEMWFNTFDDIAGKKPTGSAAGARLRYYPVAKEFRHSAAVIQSVGEGRTLRDRAARMGTAVNGGDRLIVGGWIWDMGDGLSFHVIGPLQNRIDEFQEAWDKELKKKGWAAGVDAAKVAAYLDKSPYNLASTVVLARFGSKKILLSGDARGDDIIEGLRANGLLTGASLKVDIFKVPHHGSDNNVSTEFFRTVKADHYVVSGDGNYGNPETATLKMIVDARGNSRYKVHCTYRNGIKGLKGNLTTFLNGLPKKHRQKFVFRAEGDLSMKVDLGARLPD